MATLGMDPNISQGISQLGGAMLKLPSIRADAMANAQKQFNADRTYQLAIDRQNAQIPLYSAQANYYNARAAAEQDKSLAASLFPGALEATIEYTPAVKAQAAIDATDAVPPGFQGQYPGFSSADQPMSSIAAYPGAPAMPAVPAVEASPARNSITKDPQMLARAISLAHRAGYNPQQTAAALRELMATGMMTTDGQEGQGMNLLRPGSFDMNTAVNIEDRNALIANSAANAEALARVKGELANAGALARTQLSNEGAMARQVAKTGTAGNQKLSFYDSEQSSMLGDRILGEFIKNTIKEHNSTGSGNVSPSEEKQLTDEYITSEVGLKTKTELKEVIRQKYSETKNALEAEKAGKEYLKGLKNHEIGKVKLTWKPDIVITANKDTSTPVVSPTGNNAAPSEKKTDTPADAIAPAANTTAATTTTSNLSTEAYARALRITPEEFDKRVKASGMTPSDYYKSVKDLAPTSSQANVTNTSAANGVNPVSPEKTNYVQLPGNTNTTEDYALPVESSSAQQGSFGSLLSNDSQIPESSPADAVASVPGKYSVKSGIETQENIQPKASEGKKYNFKNTDNIIGKQESPASVISKPNFEYNAEEASSSSFTQPEDKPIELQSLVTNNPFKGSGTIEETLPEIVGSPSGSEAPSTQKTPFEKLYISLIEEKRKLEKSLAKDIPPHGTETGIGRAPNGTLIDINTKKTIASGDAITKRLIEIDNKITRLKNNPFSRISPSAALLDDLTIGGAGSYYIEDASKIEDVSKRALFIDKKELMFLLQNPTVVRNSDGSPSAVYKTESGAFLPEERVFRDFDKYHEKLANYFIQEGMFDMKPGDSLARKLFQLKVSADSEILAYNNAKGAKSWLKQQGGMGGLPGLNTTIGNGAGRSSMRTGSNEYLKQHPIPEVP